MLLQRAGTGTIPPPDFVAPSWDILHRSWDEASKSILKPSSSTVTLGPADVVLGHDDVEADDTNDSKPELATLLDGVEFGWDNESPRRTVKVGEFRAEWRPITNGEYLAFRDSQSEGQVPFPCSWVKNKNTETIQVRTLYGPVSMDIAWDWPVVADYNGLAAYAAHKGGRIPTDAELRLFKDTFEVGYEGGANVGFRNWHPVP
jgi:formylglycine-generating enzyme required for sulfatase activity